jgi:hypothetical protein
MELGELRGEKSGNGKDNSQDKEGFLGDQLKEALHETSP